MKNEEFHLDKLYPKDSSFFIFNSSLKSLFAYLLDKYGTIGIVPAFTLDLCFNRERGTCLEGTDMEAVGHLVLFANCLHLFDVFEHFVALHHPDAIQLQGIRPIRLDKGDFIRAISRYLTRSIYFPRSCFIRHYGRFPFRGKFPELLVLRIIVGEINREGIMPVRNHRDSPEIVLRIHLHRSGIEGRMDGRIAPVGRIADRCPFDALREGKRHALCGFIHLRDGGFRYTVIAPLLVQAGVMGRKPLGKILIGAVRLFRPSHFSQGQEAWEGKILGIILRTVLVERHNLLEDRPMDELVRPETPLHA